MNTVHLIVVLSFIGVVDFFSGGINRETFIRLNHIAFGWFAYWLICVKPDRYFRGKLKGWLAKPKASD